MVLQRCFKKFIEINKSIKYKDQIIEKNIFSDDCLPKISIYKTKEKNPIYIDEEGIIKIGECNLEIDGEYSNKSYDREIEIIMKFGGTFIDVIMIHVKSGKKINTTFMFD